MVQQSQKTTKIKVRDNHWYFVDLINPLEPKVLKDSYDTKMDRDSCFEKHLQLQKRYFSIKGKELKQFKGDYTWIKPPYLKVIRHNRRTLPIFEVDTLKQRRAMVRRRIKVAKARALKIYTGDWEWGKYDYPEDCVTRRQRKTFRELQRRKCWKKLKSNY